MECGQRDEFDGGFGFGWLAQPDHAMARKMKATTMSAATQTSQPLPRWQQAGCSFMACAVRVSY